MNEYPSSCGYTPEPPEQKKNRSGLLMIVIALCFSLLGGALGAGIVLLAGGNEGSTTTVVEKEITAPTTTSTPQQPEQDSTDMLEGERENTVIDINKIDTSKLLNAAEVYALNVNSTVGITTSITTNYWGFQSTSAASGSGFIISDDGYILTNHHVIEDSDSITVTMFDGTDYEAALIGYDASNDIAVLKIEAEGLAPVVLGDSDNLNVGDDVVAIGNPLGELTFSLTAGKISAKGREVTFSNGVTMDLLQTDCAINSGNSGGALFNMYGEVIGVTNAKYSSSGSDTSIDNIGFAIPLNSIRDIVESIIEKGYISKPYLGVSVADVGEEYLMYGLPAGAAIQGVTEDGPAQKAGLQKGDIVTKIDGKEITGANDLVDTVALHEVGDKLMLTVYRAGQTLEVTVEVGEQIQSATQQEQTQKPSTGLDGWGQWPF
ncbi:MAG: PDZ domain-containing protein [Ruminococcaceae bacterium]|nr:PDZ domain-containing protein [Oscillospiraceae bacterium]